jgi:hypothetical protein
MNKFGEWRKPVYGIFLIIVFSFVIITYSTSNAELADVKSALKTYEKSNNLITGFVTGENVVEFNPKVDVPIKPPVKTNDVYIIETDNGNKFIREDKFTLSSGNKFWVYDGTFGIYKPTKTNVATTEKTQETEIKNNLNPNDMATLNTDNKKKISNSDLDMYFANPDLIKFNDGSDGYQILNNQGYPTVTKYYDNDIKQITHEYDGNYRTDTKYSKDGKTITQTTYNKDAKINSNDYLHSEKYDCSTGVCKVTQTCAGEDDKAVTDTKDYGERVTKKENIITQLGVDYGSGSTVSSSFDGTTTFTSGINNNKIVVNPASGTKSPRHITTTVTGKDGTVKTVTIVPSQNLFGDDKITIDGKSFFVTKCNDGGDCLKSGGTEYPIDSMLANAAKNPDDMMDLADDVYKTTFGTDDPQTRANKMDAWHTMESTTRSKVSQIFNAYINSVMGHLTNVVYEQLCDYEMYEKDSDEQKKVAGVPVPSSSWESQLEKDLYDNMRTTVFVSNVEAIGESMYRYDVLVKLIGDGSSGKWELYLKNSCDGKTSEAFWKEEGYVSQGEIFELLLAGQRGDDMIFECGVDEACKFDKVCYKYEDMASPDCSFSIAGASKITSLCH